MMFGVPFECEFTDVYSHQKGQVDLLRCDTQFIMVKQEKRTSGTKLSLDREV